MTDETQARALLELLLAPSMVPVLEESDLVALMLRAQVMDASGVFPSGTGYVPTWTQASLEGAASVGWELRAARCVGGVDFGEDGQYFKMSQRFDQCMLMAGLYRRGTSGTGMGSSRVPSIVSPDVA